jgi:hypothetical protein
MKDSPQYISQNRNASYFLSKNKDEVFDLHMEAMEKITKNQWGLISK